jgi:hypothetical protein
MRTDDLVYPLISSLQDNIEDLMRVDWLEINSRLECVAINILRQVRVLSWWRALNYVRARARAFRQPCRCVATPRSPSMSTDPPHSLLAPGSSVCTRCSIFTLERPDIDSAGHVLEYFERRM